MKARVKVEEKYRRTERDKEKNSQQMIYRDKETN